MRVWLIESRERRVGDEWPKWRALIYESCDIYRTKEDAEEEIARLEKWMVLGFEKERRVKPYMLIDEATYWKQVDDEVLLKT